MYVCVWGVLCTFVTSNRFINYIGGMSFDTDQEVGSRGPPPKACPPHTPASSGPAPEAYLGLHHMHLNGPVTYISYRYSVVTDGSVVLSVSHQTHV